MKVAIEQDGSVAFEWVKMIGEHKNSWYNDSPGYHEIAKNGEKCVYAFKRPIDLENPLPHKLEKCTEFEIQKLEKKEEKWHGF